MCGRYTLTDSHNLQVRFEISGSSVTAIEPRFNIAPSQAVPVIVERDGSRALELMRWGFGPGWLKKDTGKRQPPINARAETLLDRPMFRTSVPRQRCIIPADGFFEWQAVPGQKGKQPWRFCLKSGDLYSFAGLWANSDEGGTCCIVTTSANKLVAPVHERMPVILKREDEASWLDTDETDPGSVLALLGPYDAALMEVYPASALVNAVRNDGPELIARAN